MTTNAREEAAAAVLYTKLKGYPWPDGWNSTTATEYRSLARAVLAAADGVAPAQGVSDEQIDALMPEPRIPIDAVNATSTWDKFSRAQVRATVRAALSAFGGGAAEASRAAADVLAERRRQVAAEGWTAKHDDEHSDGSMALAAACYACNAGTWEERTRSAIKDDAYVRLSNPGFRWPWAQKWWKPKSQRQDLIRAAALLIAEIERLDRADQASRHAAATPWLR